MHSVVVNIEEYYQKILKLDTTANEFNNNLKNYLMTSNKKITSFDQ